MCPWGCLLKGGFGFCKSRLKAGMSLFYQCSWRWLWGQLWKYSSGSFKTGVPFLLVLSEITGFGRQSLLEPVAQIVIGGKESPCQPWGVWGLAPVLKSRLQGATSKRILPLCGDAYMKRLLGRSFLGPKLPAEVDLNLVSMVSWSDLSKPPLRVRMEPIIAYMALWVTSGEA